MPKKRYIVTSGQTLMDVALQLYGDITGVIALLEDNTWLSKITDSIRGGDLLVYDTDKVVDNDIAKYITQRQLVVNTSAYSEAASNSDWLISSGSWSDNGFWRDEEFWNDNP